MSKVIHNNIFFNLNQPKIFHLVEYQISNDDPVRKLSKILEAMNFNKLMQVFSHKTKIHPVRMFAVILYAYSRGIYSTRDIEIACHENIKFRFLLQNSKIPDHSTISRFLTKIENLLPELFEQFFKIIFNLENISTDTIYIDGIVEFKATYIDLTTNEKIVHHERSYFIKKGRHWYYKGWLPISE